MSLWHYVVRINIQFYILTRLAPEQVCISTIPPMEFEFIQARIAMDFEATDFFKIGISESFRRWTTARE